MTTAIGITVKAQLKAFAIQLNIILVLTKTTTTTRQLKFCQKREKRWQLPQKTMSASFIAVAQFG